MKLKHSENMRAALECRQPETAVPIWELEFQAWDNIADRHIILGTEFSRLTKKEQDFAIHDNAEIMLDVAKELNFSALTMVNSYWEIAPGMPSYYWLPEDSKKLQNALLQKYCAESGLMVVGIYGALISMPTSSQNYEEFCYRLYDEPEEFDHLAVKACERGIESAKQCRDEGYDVILSASDIADNSGPFFNEQQMERWFYPYLDKWAEGIKSMGMYSILHTDGNVTPILEKLANTPLNALQAVDPVAGMDIKKAKEMVAGRLCLCGNVETGLLVTGPGEEIYQSTRKILEDCKQGGGFVLGCSNACFTETPAENYTQMIRAWEDYGMYS